jgi:hypothetical protein
MAVKHRCHVRDVIASRATNAWHRHNNGSSWQGQYTTDRYEYMTETKEFLTPKVAKKFVEIRISTKFHATV